MNFLTICSWMSCLQQALIDNERRKKLEFAAVDDVLPPTLQKKKEKRLKVAVSGV